MYVLNGKRGIFLITSICSAIIISIFILFCNKLENTVETMAIPVTNRIIILDAGHRFAR